MFILYRDGSQSVFLLDEVYSKQVHVQRLIFQRRIEPFSRVTLRVFPSCEMCTPPWIMPHQGGGFGKHPKPLAWVA